MSYLIIHVTVVITLAYFGRCARTFNSCELFHEERIDLTPRLTSSPPALDVVEKETKRAVLGSLVLAARALRPANSQPSVSGNSQATSKPSHNIARQPADVLTAHSRAADETAHAPVMQEDKHPTSSER